MTQLRTQIPFGLNRTEHWQSDNYYANPNWGTFGTDDYPTVNSHQSGTKSSITRQVIFADGSIYNLPNSNGVNGQNVDKFYTQRSESGCYQITHNKGKGANWIFGHQGPASGDNVIKSWQRNVVGFSWQWATGNSQSAGISPRNIILLYRNKAYTNKFYGVYLIQNGNYAGRTTSESFGSKIFDDAPGYAATRSAKTSINLANNNPSYLEIMNHDLVYQGIWMEMRTNDNSSSSSSAPYKMWNCRLTYEDTGIWSADRDETKRIVLPRLWRFDSGFDRSKPLKLT